MRFKKITKIILIFFLIILTVISGWIFFVANNRPSLPKNTDVPEITTIQPDSITTVCEKGWLRKNKSGLWELYVEGTPIERGARIGALSKKLIAKQEDAFVEHIHEKIPSKKYIGFLRYFIGFFNRNLGNTVPEEYKEEIYAESVYASDLYYFIGTPYQRLMNYHAAHDIGHALQSMGMVACTSFAAWDSKTIDSTLLIGRNFDFYMGDKFTEDKIVAFINPTEGHKHMFITWGGMMGVVSGMNEKGLTVTLNALNTEIPFKSATPVSIIAREILQYAKNIEEAISIAKKRESFVSEQFLIGSAIDGFAIVIEKKPSSTEVFKTKDNQIISTNHFQTEQFSSDKEAIRQRDETASGYRYKRVSELLSNCGKLTPAAAVRILRDTKGINNADIGLGNEKSINQLIAHHSIIFAPERKMFWISTSPFQLGNYVAYNLDSVFYGTNRLNTSASVAVDSLNIPADSLFIQNRLPDFYRFKAMHNELMKTGNLKIDTDSLIQLNPDYYRAYIDAGDYWLAKSNKQKALHYFKLGLQKEIASQKERNEVLKKVDECLEK